MEGQYQFGYDDVSVYANVLRLLREHARPGGVVVDLGCGYGAIAEPCRDAGFGYIGTDVDDEGLMDLRARGFDAVPLDLEDVAAVVPAISGALGGRPLAAITMLDSLEHVTTGPEVLAALSGLAERSGGAPLVLSVPNVTHVDLAAKLLVGHWDVTETGLLDRTHVAMYSVGRLGEVTAGAGWHEVAQLDYELTQSDQHFPEDLPTLSPEAPLAGLLREVRARSGSAAKVNQFVRAYAPGAPVVAAPDVDAVFLSVITRTQGRRLTTLQDTLLTLAAQTCDDFELLLVCHDVDEATRTAIAGLVEAMPRPFVDRVRIVPATGGGRARPLNVGVVAARGRYVAILDDDDLAVANWVEQFRLLAEEHPGQVLRAVVAGQEVELVSADAAGYATVGPPTLHWPSYFAFVDHLVDNYSPVCGLAFPRICFTEMGIAFDEDLQVLEDWDVVLATTMVCGVASASVVTSVYRRWRNGHNSVADHGIDEWELARKKIPSRLDTRPLLLPPGAVSRIRELAVGPVLEEHRLGSLEHQLKQAEERANRIYHEFTTSTSWRVTAPLRAAASLFRLLRARR